MPASGLKAVSEGLAANRIVEFPLGAEIVSLMGPLGAIDPLCRFEAEQEAVARAVEKRRMEYFSGRNLARLAMNRLGVKAIAIPSNEDRTPRWPDGIIGSISHNDDYVMVAISVSPELTGLGIDVESVNGVDPELRPMIRNRLDHNGFLTDTMLFSAKESVFKAVYPICGEFLEFIDVSIVAFNQEGEFVARANTELASSKYIKSGKGRIFLLERIIVSAFFVPSVSTDF